VESGNDNCFTSTDFARVFLEAEEMLEQKI
jgi:hypothetical protein